MSSNLSDHQNQTDIDQILNEVEELRKELNTEAQTVDTQAVAKEIADRLTEAPAVATPVPAPTPVAVAAATPAPSAPAPAAPAPVTPTVAQAAQVARELAAIEEIAKAADISTTDDLMKEFNASLEQEPTEVTTDMFGTSPDDLGESMESTLAQLKEDTSVKTLLDETFDEQARRQNDTVTKEQSPMNNSNNSSNSNSGSNSGSGNSNNEAAPSLTMSLTGSMTLRLKYEFAGQEVTVGFTEECFKIELADGTEFKIPMGRQKALRRVA